MNSNLSTCTECGMAVSPGEYHPFAACLMFKACHDGDQVRANLDAVRGHSAQQDAEKVDAQPVAWYTDDNLSDKSATTWDKRVADRWTAKGWQVDPLYSAPVAAQPDLAVAGDEAWIEEAIDEVVIAALEEGMCGKAMGHTPYTDGAKAGAMQRVRALIARQRVQPASGEDAKPNDGEVVSMSMAIVAQHLADARDAGRYRWLKECNGGPIGIVAWHRDEEKEMVLVDEYANEAIDVAMQQEVK